MVENNIGITAYKGTTDLSDFIYSGFNRISNVGMKRS